MLREVYECQECSTVSFNTKEEAIFHILDTHLDKDYEFKSSPSTSGTGKKQKAKKEMGKVKKGYDNFIDDSNLSEDGEGYDYSADMVGHAVGLGREQEQENSNEWLSEDVFTCPFCGMSASEEDVKDHLVYCEKNVHYHVINTKPSHYTCTICNISFDNDKKLTDHNKLTHPGIRPYKCPLCDKDLTTRNVLMTHFKNCHMQPNRIKHKCNECNETFNKDKNFIVHMKNVHNNTKPYLCTRCNVGYNSKNGLKIHVNSVHSREQLTCEADSNCDKMFYYQTQLDEHYKTDHPDFKANYCKLCDTSYGSSYMFKRHIATGHANRQSCKYCDKVFNQFQLLDEHYKKDHGKAEPYECDICGKTFVQKYSLEKHVASHAKKPRIQCNYCTDYFAYYKDFERHNYEVHGMSEPYVCDPCSASFATKHYLTAHLSSPECVAIKKCDFCEAAFADYNELLSHRATAHIER